MKVYGKVYIKEFGKVYIKVKVKVYIKGSVTEHWMGWNLSILGIDRDL